MFRLFLPPKIPCWKHPYCYELLKTPYGNPRKIPYCFSRIGSKTPCCFAVVLVAVGNSDSREGSRQLRQYAAYGKSLRTRQIADSPGGQKIRGWFLRGGGARRLPRGVPLAVVSLSRCGGDVLRSRQVRAATPCRVCRPRSVAPCGARFFASAGVGVLWGVIGQPSRLRALWWRFWRCWRHCRAWRCYPLPLSR